MKRLLMALFVGILLLSACSPASQAATSAPTQPVAATEAAPVETATEAAAETATEAAPITLTDALGREVTLATPPQHIVITGKALFMILDAVYTFPEAPDRIAAIGSATQGSGNFISLVDPNYDAKQTLDKDAGAEQIAAVHPDLVILKSSVAETLGKTVEELNIPVVYVDFETPEQYTRDLAILGKVFQNEARAQEVAAYFQNTVADIQAKVKDATTKPRVLMLYYSDKDGAVAFNVPPMTWIQTQMVQLAGGEPVWADANPSKGWTTVTLEQIAAWDADQIFIIAYFNDPSEVVAGLKADAQWQNLRAVKENQLYAFPGDLYSWDQADPRWILGLSWLAGKLHPDQFKDADIVAQTKTFYQTLYGLDDAFFEKNIQPTFKGDLH